MKGAQWCLTLCTPMDYTVNRTLQARIQEWVAFPCPWDLPNPGIEPRSSALQVDSLLAESQDGQTHKKTLNLTNHQGNAIQNLTELSPHTCQNEYH